MSVLLYFSSAKEGSDRKYMKEYVEFRKQFGRETLGVADLEHRFAIFSENMDMINEHNKRGLSYTLGITPFTDMTFKEFKAKYLSEMPRENLKQSQVIEDEGELTTTAVDWEQKGYVSQVKD